MTDLCLRFGISLEAIIDQSVADSALAKTAANESLPYKLIKRAKAALLLEHCGANAVAGMLKTAVSTVRRWHNRYNLEGLSGLNDRPRSGRPRLFGSRFKLEVVAVVCQKPAENYLPGITHWSIRDLAMHLPRILGIDKISNESVRKILKEHHLKPHRLEYYLTKTDPDFFQKAERILDLYQNPPSDGLIISVDERTAIQVLERLYPGKPLRPYYPEKMEFHYRRHPTFTLLAALSISDGDVFGRCYQRHTQFQFLDFLQQLVAFYADVKLYVVLDNLKTHKTQLIRNWLATQNDRIEFIFTPFHGSWLNQIEIWFNILQKKCLNRMDCPGTEDGKTHVLSFIDTWNAYYAKPFNWKFTSADLEIMLKQKPIELPAETVFES